MKTNVDISIIVPAYNASSSIKKCLESLINQTKKELEFIIINDGSTDDTEKKVKEFTDLRIKYFKNKNQGIGKSRNIGIEKATGKYIMFVDSDDYLELTACEKLFNKAKKDKLDIVVCDFYCVNENKIKEEKLISFSNTTLKETPNLINNINLSPWNKIYRASLIKTNNIKFIEDLKYEDAPFVIIALDKAQKIGKINECLNYYIIHKNSETTIRDKKVFDILKILNIIRTSLKNKPYLAEDLNKLTVRIITNYTIQQRVQQDKDIKLKFINAAFNYLKKEVPDYKKNKYFKNRNFFQKTIERSKLLTIIYCSLYRNK